MRHPVPPRDPSPVRASCAPRAALGRALLLALACAAPALGQDGRLPARPGKAPEPVPPAETDAPAPAAVPAATPSADLGAQRPDGQVDHGHLGGSGTEEVIAVVPPGFTDQIVLTGWSQPVGVTFGSNGRAYVWEKRGKVWIVEDDAVLPAPFADLTEEIGNWDDHGLLGFALDPAFDTNHYVYFLYVVDYHHLTKFGTPQYNATANEYQKDTIGRVTRYQASAANDYKNVFKGSRTVLLGESITTGIPICGSSHGVGSLVFGEDGTLLVSVGDGAPGDGNGGCIADGILAPEENLSGFRSQYVNSLSGKILRLDPTTGDGVPSNPFYDPLAPRAPRSRVWTLGLRNPCRMSVRAGTGSADPSLGDPGSIYVGDVGAEHAEELDVVTSGGLNLGWPLYEGLEPNPVAQNSLIQNPGAPNPLYAGPGSACPLPNFKFKDMLVQDSQDAPSWPNPCDPGQQIVTSAPLFVHRRPVIEWIHDGPSRMPVYDAQGLAAVQLFGEPGAPIAGGQFSGNCSIGGTFSGGVSFPPEYDDVYFIADYGVGWIRAVTFGPDDVPVAVAPFAEPVGRPVQVHADPYLGDLWYIDYTFTGAGQLHRIRHLSGNTPPVAVATVTPGFGPLPITAAFDGSASNDPDDDPLGYRWTFSDGTPPSILAQPVRSFPAEDVTAQGTFIGLVFDLVPSGSTGFSNLDPEVMRDGDMPPPGTGDDQRQYDTIHAVGGVPDKGNLDWFGYAFPAPRTFTSVLFQEGMNYNGGGFFLTWALQVRQDGEWVDVQDVTVTPAYPSDLSVHYETFEFRFPDVTGDAIRLYGDPGGVSNLDFTTIGELRVTARPDPMPTAAFNVDATLTVRDVAQAESSETVTVSVGNTPPHPQILTPADWSLFDGSDVTMIEMTQASVDDEQGGALTCSWQVILHHDNHTHPDLPIEACESQALLSQHNACEADVHWYEVRLTSTDPLGLSATTYVHLIPDCDRNMNGVDDAIDIASGASKDKNGDGIPDEAQTDCNGNGIYDALELSFGMATDRNGNKLPDECDGFGVPEVQKKP